MAAQKSLNRAQLLKTVAERTGMAKKEVEQVYETTLATIQESVKGGTKVALSGFGNFKQRVRKAREAINPRTGEKIRVAAAKLPRFLPAKAFKQYVGGELKSPPVMKASAPAKKSAPKKAAPKKAAAKKAPAKRKR